MATGDRGNRRFDDDDPSRDTGWSHSARQVWLAGVGAWSRAQAEGGKLFDSLVRDGMAAEREGSRFPGAREAVDRGTEEVRGFATHTRDRLGQVVEDTVQRTLARLGVPRREELQALERRIDALSAELREARAAAAGPGAPARRRSTPRKPPASA